MVKRRPLTSARYVFAHGDIVPAVLIGNYYYYKRLNYCESKADELSVYT